MKVAIVGAGPAGLYLACRLQQLGGFEIEVHEREGERSASGIGYTVNATVVAALRQLDRPAADRLLMRRGVTMAPRAVFRVGDAERSLDDLPRFGLLRADLLEHLRELALLYGVSIRFGHPVFDVADVSGADVVVAADGAGSALRASRSAAFEITDRSSASRLFWASSRVVPEALTFTLHRSKAGAVACSSYPIGRDRAAFVAELCPAPDATPEALATLCRDVETSADPESAVVHWERRRRLVPRIWRDRELFLVGDAAFAPDYTLGLGLEWALTSAHLLARCLHAGETDGYSEAVSERIGQIEPLERWRRLWVESAWERTRGLSGPEALSALVHWMYGGA